uniref:Uncharacterized protein n=1 Tax=Candidatus Kentrum sp. SD TaxID=2126332 RepID=A0A450YAX3_9GAMM|nr:MAG: hypothetical protein BECKSD772F_GA0070984_100187 [Candidatus Kentron sp. SD]VFK38700.1 MAG: hypothetical protein BECKSD772E_GA0070983_100186 [Candidatus Kentron sp. SD]
MAVAIALRRYAPRPYYYDVLFFDDAFRGTGKRGHGLRLGVMEALFMNVLNVRKEERIKAIIAEQGEHPGLVQIF